jgi:sulfur carrier protein
MKIIVNGQDKAFNHGATVLDVLRELALEERVMAAAVNMNIVKQDKWNSYVLADGDKLELLDFVGGG